jgi:hypothetical protein
VKERQGARVATLSLFMGLGFSVGGCLRAFEGFWDSLGICF